MAKRRQEVRCRMHLGFGGDKTKKLQAMIFKRACAGISHKKQREFSYTPAILEK